MYYMKKMDKQKRISAELILANFLKNTPEHIYWKDLSGVYLGCNDNQAKTLGFSTAASIIGKTDFELSWSKESAETFRQNDLDVINTGVAKTIEEVITIDNKEMTVLSLKAPIKDANGHIYGILGISIDITDRKLAEKKEKIALIKAEKEKNTAIAEAEFRRAISIFAGSIGHDLRTPLTSLLLTIDLFQLKAANIFSSQPDSNEKNIESPTEYCINFTTKLKKIIHEMNDFINITLKSMRNLFSGSLTESDFILCRMEDCLNEVLMKYPFKEQEKSLVNIEHIDNFEFLFHPVLFYRILFNLITNSLQQIEKNERGKIYIFTENRNNTHILHFKDTAGGASEETINKLFSGYHTTKKEGTGVGLAFCKLAMQSCGGDITCHSKEGDYIEFELFFSSIERK